MRNQAVESQHDEPVRKPPSLLDEPVEDRAMVNERASYLADRKVAQLKAARVDDAGEVGTALDVDLLDEAVDAGEHSEDAGGGGGELGDGATTTVAGSSQAEPEAESGPATASQAAEPVPPQARAAVESTAGMDLSSVRVHRDSALAEQLGAEAMTMGDEIHLAPGAAQPETPAGRRLMSHELTHVVQQREGRVEGADGTVNDDPALEAEADEHAERASGGAVDAAAPARAASASGSSTPVQRKAKVKKVAARYENAATLRAMKLADFLGYVKGQLDWAVKLTPADKAPIQEVLTWAMRAPFLGGGCAKIPVDELITAGDRHAIEEYARGVNMPESAPTARVAAVDSAAAAIAIGAALLKLRTAIDGRCLYHISTPETIKSLIDDGVVESLVTYVHLCAPVLHADGGKELRSFMRYVKEVGDPAKYNGSVPKVRNYHRFEAAALETLATNFQDHSRTRPLALILHSALDHNGAFHRDPNLTALIQHGRNNVLMVEGLGSLSACQAEIGPLAKGYGQRGKLDQVMIAGHGSSKTMELAGTAEAATEPDGTPTMAEKGDGLDLRPNADPALDKQDETKALFGEIIANMEEDPTWPWEPEATRRVVFNACLTGANSIKITPIAEGGAPYADQIKDSLANTPGLATSFRQQATAAGKDIESLGANGSFGQIELMHALLRVPAQATETDDAGNVSPKFDDAGAPVMTSVPIAPDGIMDLGSAEDPALTAPKMQYLEKGADPAGVMLALLEVWTAPTGAATPWQTAADKRIAAAGSGWKDTQIKTLLTLVRSKYNDNPPAIKKLIQIANATEFLDSGALSRPWIAKMIAEHPDGAAILAGLRTCDELEFFTLVVMLHASAILGHGGELLDELDVGWTVTVVREFIDAKLLADKGVLAPLLTPTTTPRPGQVILAASDVFKGGGTAESKAFLTHLLAGSSQFPAHLKIGELLGNKTEDDLLKALGVVHAAGATETANVNLDGDRKNEHYLEPVNLPGLVTASSLHVRRRPDRGAHSIGELTAGESVFVVGRSGEWLGIDFRDDHGRGRIAFVHGDHVTVS